ncbi:hypothetical protein MAUB1S_02962 [Mycolicibacterium aubagnense]
MITKTAVVDSMEQFHTALEQRDILIYVEQPGDTSSKVDQTGSRVILCGRAMRESVMLWAALHPVLVAQGSGLYVGGPDSERGLCQNLPAPT